MAEFKSISANGSWLLIGETDHFISFENSPWLKQPAVGHVLNIELPGEHHHYWPEPDVDLAVNSIRHFDQFPLVSKVGASKALQLTAGAGNVRD